MKRKPPVRRAILLTILLFVMALLYWSQPEQKKTPFPGSAKIDRTQAGKQVPQVDQADKVGPKREALLVKELLELPVGPPLSLVGTSVASHPRWSTATIVDVATGKSKVYRIGDMPLDDTKLVGIKSNKVVLDIKGKRESLYIQKAGHNLGQRTLDQVKIIEPGEPPTVKPSPLAPDRPAPDQPEAKVDKAIQKNPSTFRIDRNELDEIIDNPQDILKNSQISLAFDSGGKIEGIRLTIDPADEILYRIGIESGDILHRIGDIEINNPKNLSGILDQLDQIDDFEIELTRDNTRFIQSYRLD
jgi:type II secretory pathway component PulC